MTVKTVAHIRSVGYTLYDSVHLAELLNLQTAETLSRCAVDCIEVTILLLELVYFVVNIFQYFQRELAVLTDRFAIVKLLQLIQCGDTKGSCHRFQKFTDLFVRFQMSAIETALTVCQRVRGCTHLSQVFIRTDMQVTDHL